MEPTPGKLKNRDTGEELAFALNPTEYRLARSLEYTVEPCLGQAAPVVAYRSGGAAELGFELVFDQDAEPRGEVKKVQTFLQNLNKVQAGTKSVPLVEFTLGTFTFRGYVRQYTYRPVRFDAQGNATSARLACTVLSNGDYENGKA